MTDKENNTEIKVNPENDIQMSNDLQQANDGNKEEQVEANSQKLEIKEEAKEDVEQVSIPKIGVEDNNANSDVNMKLNDNAEAKLLNSEYYNELNQPKYNEIVDYENKLRQEIEEKSPLISDILPVDTLIAEYKESIFANSIQEITKKYKSLRYARRDGNCFYRSYLFRLFEHICLTNDKATYESVLKKVENCRNMIELNGFDWIVIEDFYNAFISEFKFLVQLEQNEKIPYLNLLFSDKEKGNYMIAFVRMFISAYIKENRFLYENFILDEDLDSWCRREVEPIDVECDHLQIIAVTNCFNVGVIIENLNEKRIELMKFPEEGVPEYFIHLFFRPGHYDILYPL